VLLSAAGACFCFGFRCGADDEQIAECERLIFEKIERHEMMNPHLGDAARDLFLFLAPGLYFFQSVVRACLIRPSLVVDARLFH
jgi:hypothetical protein